MSHFWRHFRNLFLRNARLKAVSLMLASLLWIALNDEPRSEIGLRVPLEFRNSPKDVEVLGEAVNSVDLRLSASSSLVRRIDASNVTASIDLSDWSLGERTYLLSESNVSTPFGVTVTKVSPSKIRLRFEQMARKIIKIRPRIIGKPAAGHYVGALVCHPDRVQVEGPPSHLEGVLLASTDSLDISGRTASVSARLHIYVDDPLVRLSAPQETQVDVTIQAGPTGIGQRDQAN